MLRDYLHIKQGVCVEGLGIISGSKRGVRGVLGYLLECLPGARER